MLTISFYQDVAKNENKYRKDKGADTSFYNYGNQPWKVRILNYYKQKYNLLHKMSKQQIYKNI